MKGDHALALRARRRNTSDASMAPLRQFSVRDFQCPTCGRTWEVTGAHVGDRLKSFHGRAAGFVKTGAKRHAVTCGTATPAERRAIARIDEARWKKVPPVQKVENHPEHPGYGGVLFRTETLEAS